MDDPAEIGRKLGIPPCPCGEPLGARYGPRHVCWPCAGIRAPRPSRRRPTRFQAFHDRVWDRLEILTDSPIFLMDVGRAACYCPRCLDGTMVVRFRDAEKPLITITHGDSHGGCSLGCTEREIGEVLFR